MISVVRDFSSAFCQKELAGPNKSNPAILGMVGLGLHLSNERDARILKVRAMRDGGVEHSLVGSSFFFRTALLKDCSFH